MQKFISKLRGIGLLELMLSLAIIAILLVMATRYFSSASRSQKAEDTIQLIGEFEAAINSYTSSTGDAKTKATIAELRKQGYLSPYRFQSSGGTATDNLKEIWGEKTNYVAGTSLEFTSVPSTECFAMAARFGSDSSLATCGAGSDATGSFTYYFK